MLPHIKKHNMKSIAYLILIFVVLISCQTETKMNLESYKSGIEVIEKIDSNGNIDYTNAHELFSKSVKVNPNHIESKYWKSYCEIQLGQFDKALMTSTTVIQDEENVEHVLLPHFYVTAGLVEKINGNINNSILYFENAANIYDSRIKKNINDIDAIMNYAIVLCYIDKKDTAVSFLNTISLNDEKQTELEQLRVSISDFDADKAVLEIKKSKK